MMGLVGLNETWGHTGAVNQGGADNFTTLEPAFDWGKGFGDLPDAVAFLQPFFAVTGNLSVDFPTKVFNAGALNQNIFNAGFAIEYSLEFLEHHVRDIGLRPPFDRLIPLVEITTATPLNRGTVLAPGGAGFATNNLGHATTGVIAPGLIWSGQDLSARRRGDHSVRRRAGVMASAACSRFISISTTCFPTVSAARSSEVEDAHPDRCPAARAGSRGARGPCPRLPRPCLARGRQHRAAFARRQ